MPAPVRYRKAIPEMVEIWGPPGTFRAQTRVWEAQCEARNKLFGAPTGKQLKQIRAALVLTDDDLDHVNQPTGHETNRLLTRVQSKLPKVVGNFLHKGNTSSDVLDTALALQIRESLDLQKKDTHELSDALASLALQHKDTEQVHRTHGQHGLVGTFGRQVLGWYAGSKRIEERLDRAREIAAFGKMSGEIGTHTSISPELEEAALAKLRLKPEPAATQVIPRDRHAEVLTGNAINASELHRITLNIRLLTLTGIGEVMEPFDKVGSSSMPHKRNPELCERVEGLARIARAMAVAGLESIPLWLERDISHSSTERYSLSDSFQVLNYATGLTTEIIKGLVVFTDAMAVNLNVTNGGIYSARLFNSILDTGKLPRQEAHALVKGLAHKALDGKKHLKDLAGKNETIVSLLTSKELAEVFDSKNYLKNISVGYQRLGLIPIITDEIR
jgi:adenylosuccinate lyase